MGVSREEAARNRNLILAAAERLFREKGVDAVGLAELMQEAGFTQGGFYNHFASKEALVSEVIDRAMEEGQQQLEAAIDQSHARGVNPLVRQIEWYLSKGQCDDIQCGCPVAGFAGAVPHLSAEAQAIYAKALDRILEQMTGMVMESDGTLNRRKARRRAVSLYAHMVGSVLLSRAVADHPDLANEILEDGRAEMLASIESPPKKRLPRKKLAVRPASKV